MLNWVLLKYGYSETISKGIIIGMKPKYVNQKHVKAILIRLNIPNSKYVKPKFTVDDRVRISKYKHAFKKGYLLNWTNEIYRVYDVRF